MAPPNMALKDPSGNCTDDPQRCAELLNKFFQDQFCPGHGITDLPKLSTDTDDLEISVEGVKKLIASLANGKSPGPDGIRKPDLLIDIEAVASCLAIIFRASLKTGKLPTQWKMANVTAVHKGGELDLPNNYRPISLTSIPCKMLEHIVLHHLNQELDKVLHNRQHGFRQTMSCETQLCATYNDLAKSAEATKSTHAVTLDFKKAFDKVPHDLLMEKVRNISNLHPILINWIQDFLTNRKQRVIRKGASSGERQVTSGVPQGSVLGPTLFLIYINDLPTAVSCQVSLYADDTLLYQEVTSENDVRTFQSNIDAVHKWSKRWHMPFNETKCQAMSFGGDDLKPPYRLGDVLLTWVSETKYLGVTIQSDLKFDKHIAEKTQKARKILGAIKHTLFDAPKDARLLAYTSLCRPILEYADTVWDPTNKQTMHSIEMIQNNAVRYIERLKGRESVSEARDRLQLKSLADRRKDHRLSLLFKILEHEDRHSALSSSYDELIGDRAGMTMTTRAASGNQPTSIFASSQAYHNSFLPRTIRDLRLSTHRTNE